MKQKQQLLYKVMLQFMGMNKLDVFDLLYKIEEILMDAKSPITKEYISQAIQEETTSMSLQFTILPNGNFCEFVESNSWLSML